MYICMYVQYVYILDMFECKYTELKIKDPSSLSHIEIVSMNRKNCTTTVCMYVCMQNAQSIFFA